jgi:ribosomal protein L37AE/L43A
LPRAWLTAIGRRPSAERLATVYRLAAWLRRLKETMSEIQFNEKVMRPTMCPFCKSKVLDALAKVITATTFWRCRDCDGTWTIASPGTSPERSR